MALPRLILLSLLCEPGLSLPVNQTEPSYKSGPDGRGTISLLWSSTVTFGLCVWTVVHPNVVPWPGFWDKLYYKLWWMGTAVLFPEFIVAVAVFQWREAKRINRRWVKEFEGFEDEQPVKDWLGMSGAFFVVMGGFVVHEQKSKDAPDVTQAPEDNTPPAVETGIQDSPKRTQKCEPDLVTTICPSGFEELLEKRILHKTIREGKLTAAHFLSRNIDDKGKADGVAKFLVVLQILWMAVQCLGRKLTGLPVTLLECHVLIQILFSIVAYGFWWHKPLDVDEPIVLTLERSQWSKLGPDIRHTSRTFSVYPKFITEQRYRGGIGRFFGRVAYDIMVNTA